MYFVKRGEIYHDVAGAHFSDLLAGRLSELPGERATIADWANHLSTIFPEVRLKRYLEMRGADAGPRPFLLALPALFAGLLYEPSVLDAAWDVVKLWSAEHVKNCAPMSRAWGSRRRSQGRPAAGGCARISRSCARGAR